MNPEHRASAYAAAAKEFNARTGRDNGRSAAEKLDQRLVLLQDLLYSRLHGDVQQAVGMDSMLMPISELKTQLAAKTDISLYQIAESRAAVVELGARATADDWYSRWLARLLLGEPIDADTLARLDEYGSKSPRERMLAFTDVLARVLPESRRAPLVLFNLFPISVWIATAIAWGDRVRAAEFRKKQLDLQPALGDCTVCRGQLLATGKQCRQCGNPVWKYDWLVAD
ncbi:MAG: hypothetical protein KKE86_14240 [Planctomycetes bacterium]|nr:hypothetical protein [Planctomycetota bacterium]MBU4400480.1 hypothetical protein [Planctomycetota bacterium]MCG2685137.1 hypothetical protein [Planctomycetales bacterium]